MKAFLFPPNRFRMEGPAARADLRRTGSWSALDCFDRRSNPRQDGQTGSFSWLGSLGSFGSTIFDQFDRFNRFFQCRAIQLSRDQAVQGTVYIDSRQAVHWVDRIHRPIHKHSWNAFRRIEVYISLKVLGHVWGVKSVKSRHPGYGFGRKFGRH